MDSGSASSGGLRERLFPAEVSRCRTAAKGLGSQDALKPGLAPRKAAPSRPPTDGNSCVSCSKLISEPRSREPFYARTGRPLQGNSSNLGCGFPHPPPGPARTDQPQTAAAPGPEPCSHRTPSSRFPSSAWDRARRELHQRPVIRPQAFPSPCREE